MNDTIYRGEKTEVGYLVTANGRPLTPAKSHQVTFHADGFSWGYRGAGPKQLALALLLDATGNAEGSRRWEPWYLWLGPACWGDRWETTAAEIRDLVDGLGVTAERPQLVEGGVA